MYVMYGFSCHKKRKEDHNTKWKEKRERERECWLPDSLCASLEYTFAILEAAAHILRWDIKVTKTKFIWGREGDYVLLLPWKSLYGVYEESGQITTLTHLYRYIYIYIEKLYIYIKIYKIYIMFPRMISHENLSNIKV